MLSVVSLITFVVSKIAVGIFAGGVVFGTLLPEMHVTIGPVDIDSFWIGSVLVIVLTGLYTALGGMRAVAYNDAVQVDGAHSRIGVCSRSTACNSSAAGTSCARCCGSDMFNLWKPLIPAGVAEHLGAGARNERAGQIVREAWYFNGNFPWLGHADLRADHRPLVLVHRPVHRAARARRAERAGRAPRQHLRRVPEAVSRLPLHHSRA